MCPQLCDFSYVDGLPYQKTSPIPGSSARPVRSWLRLFRCEQLQKKFQENPRIIPLLCAFFCFCNHPASQSARFKMVWTLVWSLWLENIDLNKNHSELTYAIIICKSKEIEFEPHTNAFVSARCRWSQTTLVIFLCWEEKDPGAPFFYSVILLKGRRNPLPLQPDRENCDPIFAWNMIRW